MSKYSYHIAFNVSDYSEVFPEKPIKITGKWENDSWIDRVEVDEVKIHKADNITIYDTLEAWVIDKTKYSTECFFQIKKDSVAWKTFVFGIRWGTIDTETCVYKFKPQAYDSYYRYWGTYADLDITTISAVYGNWIPDTNFEMHYGVYDYTSTNYPYVTTLNPILFADWQAYQLFDLIETIVNNKSMGITLKSTILNNDSTTVLTVAVNAGIPFDYVSNKENVFINAGIKPNDLFKYTIKQLFDFLKIFQIDYFFEDATTLRIEHVYYMIKQIQDNAVALTLDDDENELEFLDDSVPLQEDFILDEEVSNLDTDFHKQVIKYTPARTGFSGSVIQNNYSQLTDIEKYIAVPADFADKEIILASPYQHIAFIEDGGVNVNLNYQNDFQYVELAAIPVPIALYSNDIKFDEGFTTAAQFACVVEMTYMPRTATACFRKRATGALISDEQILSIGTNTFTLTSNGASDDDAVFCIYFTPLQFDVFEGWATVQTVYNASIPKPYRLAAEQGQVTGTFKNNGPFSQANILENWWKVNRPTNAGTINDVAKTFTNSQFIIKRQLKARYWPNDINMQFGINDGSHIAKIGRYTRDLDSDFVTFELLYQEYE